MAEKMTEAEIRDAMQKHEPVAQVDSGGYVEVGFIESITISKHGECYIGFEYGSFKSDHEMHRSRLAQGCYREIALTELHDSVKRMIDQQMAQIDRQTKILSKIKAE